MSLAAAARMAAWLGVGLACGGPASGEVRFVAGGTPVGEFTLPVRSVLDQRYYTVIRQRYDFSCGSAALASLLRFHYGRRVGEDDAFRGMWARGDRAEIRRLGFSLLDMKRYLTGIGLDADGYRVTLDQIAHAGLPGIALITVRNYHHFVVVKGVSAREVLVGDPSTGLHPMSRAAFQAAWNGVYFALNAEQDVARAGFNRNAQWRAFARAPTAEGGLTDPLSLQSLALTAPFYRDF